MTTGSNAPERLIYHEWIEKFKTYLSKGQSVYDIGCFSRHDYHETMKDYNYKTIDNNPNQNPDIVVDAASSMPSVDGIMCHGVHSECKNPFKLTYYCWENLKENGVALFGIVLLDYPQYHGELWRFTLDGVKKMLRDFHVIEERVVYRNEPSFYFCIARK